MKAGRHKVEIQTGLGRYTAPVSGALVSNGILYTSVVPRRSDGTVETGDADAQIRLTFDNLQATLKAAGGTLDDVVQVLVHLTDRSLFPLMNEIYKTYFVNRPFPNRATSFASSLSIEGMVIELVVQAHIG